MIHAKKWMVVPYESEDEDKISDILINPKLDDFDKISNYNNELLKNKNKLLQIQTTEQNNTDQIPKKESEINLVQEIKNEPIIKKESDNSIKNDLKKEILQERRKKNLEMKKEFFLFKKNNNMLNTSRTPMKKRLRGQKRELNRTHIQNHSMYITDEKDDLNKLSSKRQYNTINREKKILKKDKNDEDIEDSSNEDNFDPVYNQFKSFKWSFNDQNIPSINVSENNINDSLMDAN